MCPGSYPSARTLRRAPQYIPNMALVPCMQKASVKGGEVDVCRQILVPRRPCVRIPHLTLLQTCPQDMAINCGCFSGVSCYSDPHYLGSTLGHLIFGTSQIWELASLDAAWESLCIQGARNTGIAEGKHPKQIQPRPSVEAWALILRW